MKRIVCLLIALTFIVTAACSDGGIQDTAAPAPSAENLPAAIATEEPTKEPTATPTSAPSPTPTASPVPVYELYGVEVAADAEELSLEGIELSDTIELEILLPMLPKLSRVTMCGCKLSDDDMASLADAYPDIKFVWEISLGYWGKLRTDATAFSTRSSKSADELRYRLESDDIVMLRYCTELVALDLGHQHIEDISPLKSLTKLQVLILADNWISDLTPLAGMQELSYLELFINRIEDVSPLAELKNLEDLNLCSNRIEDISPLSELKNLKRLWYSNNKYSLESHNALAEAIPSCRCNRTVWDATADGWRETDRYFWMRVFFEGAPRYK